MSYRNPPIIVDRSTDVWGKAIAGFGQQVAQGILSVSEARRKAEAAQAAQARKEAQAQQKLTTATRASYMDAARDKYIQIKKNGGLSLAQQFMKQVEIDLNGADGKTGAIDASVQLALNTSLDADQRKKYNKIVDSAKMYQAEAVSGFANVMSGLDYAKEKGEDTQTKPGGWTYKGGNKKEMFSNQLLHYALDTDVMINDDVIEDRKTYKGKEGEIFVEGITLVPVEQFNEGGTFAETLDEGELEDVEKVTKGNKVYYKFSSKKDIRQWDGELVTDIPALPDYSKVYQEVNIENDKGSVNTNLVSEIQRTEGGYDYKEKILDIGTIRKNLESVMSGQASRIMAGSDQEIQAFTTFALEKGGMTMKQFNKDYPDRSQRVEYIKNALIDDSINKKFSSEFGSNRLATAEDVERIKAANPSSTIEVGQEIRFNLDKQAKVEQEDIDDPTQFEIKVGQARKAAPGILKEMTSPDTAGSYFKNKKIGGKNIVDVKVIDVPAADSGTGKGDDAKSSKILELKFVSGSSIVKGEKTEFTDTMKFDLNNPTRLKTLIDLLPDSDVLKQELKDLLDKKLKKVNTGNLPIIKNN
jgi:hypothetical protein